MKSTASRLLLHLQKHINEESAPINIHPQLQADGIIIGKFPLCHLLLMNDSNYPWFVLVPEREDIAEIHQLTEADQHQLISESSTLSRCIEQLFDADKINIAALGNIVPQLHIHHIVRYRTDAAWPAPVWGKLAAKPYTEGQLAQIIDKLKDESIAELEYRR